jgi:hypothetical protein
MAACRTLPHRVLECALADDLQSCYPSACAVAAAATVQVASGGAGLAGR